MRTHARLTAVAVPAALLAIVAGAGGCVSSDKPAPHWSYRGETGPARWGEINPEWSLAREGRAQSPINLTRDNAVEADLPPLRFSAAPTTVRAVDNGHTVRWDCVGANTLTIGNEVYALTQFHFHAPSEHTVEGRNYPVELHFVHENAKGNLAVVAAMLTESRAPSEIYAALARTIPGDAQATTARFNPYALLPRTRNYATYRGSLTTPPCTEGVRWVVLTTPARASRAQIASFTETYTGNARPIQPAHGRIVLVDE